MTIEKSVDYSKLMLMTLSFVKNQGQNNAWNSKYRAQTLLQDVGQKRLDLSLKNCTSSIPGIAKTEICSRSRPCSKNTMKPCHLGPSIHPPQAVSHLQLAMISFFKLDDSDDDSVHIE
jgi:hypothetical protein